MAFKSKLYGRQVNKAVTMAAHEGIGSLLTFDSSTKFPTPLELMGEKVPSGKLEDSSIDQYFNYQDTSTHNIYVDASTNIMYRWKHYTLDEWKKAYWEQDENGNFIEPVKPTREDYDTDEEYEEALADYNNSIYPVTNAGRGWKYVPCAGGGSGASDLYWEEI